MNTNIKIVVTAIAAGASVVWLAHELRRVTQENKQIENETKNLEAIINASRVITERMDKRTYANATAMLEDFENEIAFQKIAIYTEE